LKACCILFELNPEFPLQMAKLLIQIKEVNFLNAYLQIYIKKKSKTQGKIPNTAVQEWL